MYLQLVYYLHYTTYYYKIKVEYLMSKYTNHLKKISVLMVIKWKLYVLVKKQDK